jgi:hypothetical protein
MTAWEMSLTSSEPDFARLLSLDIQVRLAELRRLKAEPGRTERQVRRVLDIKRHGISGYSFHVCRCEAGTRDYSEYRRLKRIEREQGT